VGRTLDKYQVYVGGDIAGTRLNTLYADLVPRAQLVATVRPLLLLYKERRLIGEAFGDFCNRLGVAALREAVASPPPSYYNSLARRP
jgi:sulfite reductase (ferredoxin)